MIWQLILADFRERTRRYSFLVTLAFVFFFGMLVITGKFSVYPNHCLGEHNSAWVGATMALGATTMTIIVGFFLVKNCLRRDRITRVGQILAGSSMSNWTYLLAKFASNILTLSVMVFLLVPAAVLMQFLGTSPLDLQLWKLIAPFLIVTLPVVVLVSALALVFETIPLLSGGFGNVAYFFTMPFWFSPTALNLVGSHPVINSMQAAAQAAYPANQPGYSVGFVSFAGKDISTFPILHWNGVDWTWAMIVPRLAIVITAVVIVAVALPFFRRFDESPKQWRKIFKRSMAPEPQPEHRAVPAAANQELQPVKTTFRFLQQARAEFILLLNRLSWRWHVVALGLIVAQFLAPAAVVRTYLLPAAWVWPLLIWSSLGARERMFNTEALVFSSAHPLFRQLAALWLAGITFTALTGGGAIFRAALSGDANYLATLLVATAFIPTLALTLGLLSGGSQLFEIVYVFIWYLGPINHIPVIDYLATTNTVVPASTLRAFLALTLLLIPVAFVSRKRQLGA